MEKKKRLILVGKGGAGKDYARKMCEQWFGLTYQISYTTRHPREDEQDGIDYHFIPMRVFNRMINEDKWYEHVKFNGWNYGTTREQFYTENSVFIMTPSGLSHLSSEDREESLVIFLDIPKEERSERMYARKANVDSVERRLQADEIDFVDFLDYDVKISDPYYKIIDVYKILIEYMNFPSRKKYYIENDGTLVIRRQISTEVPDEKNDIHF
jgi:guanylate kinase